MIFSGGWRGNAFKSFLLALAKKHGIALRIPLGEFEEAGELRVFGDRFEQFEGVFWAKLVLEDGVAVSVVFEKFAVAASDVGVGEKMAVLAAEQIEETPHESGRAELVSKNFEEGSFRAFSVDNAHFKPVAAEGFGKIVEQLAFEFSEKKGAGGFEKLFDVLAAIGDKEEAEASALDAVEALKLLGRSGKCSFEDQVPVEWRAGIVVECLRVKGVDVFGKAQRFGFEGAGFPFQRNLVGLAEKLG